ncbi:hypothetical protein FOZ63_031239, partial [Perkinsus olseni]
IMACTDPGKAQMSYTTNEIYYRLHFDDVRLVLRLGIHQHVQQHYGRDRYRQAEAERVDSEECRGDPREKSDRARGGSEAPGTECFKSDGGCFKNLLVACKSLRPTGNSPSERRPAASWQLELSHVDKFIKGRHVAVLAVWKREQLGREWAKHAEKYDAVLQLESRPPAADARARHNQKSNLMRSVCQDIRGVSGRFSYTVESLATRLIYLFNFDLVGALGEVLVEPAGSGASPTVPQTPSKAVTAASDRANPGPPSASASASASRVQQGQTENYWFKRLDERLVAILGELREVESTMSESDAEGPASEPAPTLQEQKEKLREERATRKRPAPKSKAAAAAKLKPKRGKR